MSLHRRLPALDRNIICWGDSLTGCGTQELPYRWPNVLGRMLDWDRTITNFGVSGETSAQIEARHLAYLQAPQKAINILWAGRNNFTSNSAAEIVADIQAMVDNVADDRFVVCTVPVSTTGGEGSGSANDILLETLKDLIISTWPDNYIDIKTLVGDDGDLRDSGDLHWNTAGSAVVAEAIYDFIVAKGW